MRVVRLFLKLLLCFSLVVSGWPALAQDVKDLLGIQQEQIKSLETKLILVEDMLADIIANTAADRMMQTLADSEKAKVDVEARKPDVDTSIQTVAKIPDGQLPDGVKPRIETCLAKIKEATGKLNPDGGANVAAACSVEEADKIGAELKKARDDAVKTWKECRDTLQAVQNVGPTSLPTNPSGLSSQGVDATRAEIERLTNLVNNKSDEAKNCATGIKDTFEKVRSIETAAGALSAALSVAAAICVATAGTGCAVMAAIAMILKLFDRGGGGGTGRGKGKGPDRGGDLPGKDVGDCTSNCAPKQQPPVQPQVTGIGPIIDGGDINGRVQCGSASVTAMDCVRTGAASPKVRIDAVKGFTDGSAAEKDLTAAIGQKNLKGVYFCLGADPNFLKGFVLKSSEQGKSYLISIEYAADRTTTLLYPPSSIATPADPGNACASMR
jgi:hypothetical protein